MIIFSMVQSSVSVRKRQVQCKHGKPIKQDQTNKLSMRPRQPLGLLFYFCGSSVVFMVFGILLLGLWSVLYHAILRSQMVLKPNNKAFDIWVKNPVPLTLKFHIFNWTNPEDIHNATVKPRFVELGPYYYVETKEKTNITWNANDTISFKHLKTWWYDQSRSNGSLSDPFTTINPISLSAAYTARYWNYVVKRGLSFSLQSMVQSISVTHSVGETLFDGYEDSLMAVAAKLPFLSKNNLPFSDKFGWFYGRNGSEDYEGVYNMNTGVDGRLGELNSWRNMNQSTYYPGKCGVINGGSAGEFFPTDLKKDEVVRFFSSDMCRYLELEFEEEVIIGGLVGYKYSAGERFLDNGTNIPENKCYCDGNCMPSGALNVSLCKHGSPAFISLPHFYKADPYYINSVDGLNPSKEKSEFFMIFEPNTGIPLQVSVKLQLNLRLEPVDGITLYSEVPTIYLPVLHFEQAVIIPENMLFLLKLLVNFKVICYAVGILCVVLGSIICLCISYKISSSKFFKKRKQNKAIIQEEMPLKQ
ncbi:unnamed protein product [Phaedon cochleariae]|uniref:Uncharacterized protein n=1 Tax=Phaedon cochleariae TaxID=80249 RepID=A0A9P0DML7_PHACE|nr:unnamed protein product [Phaedon cochleariae]